MASVKMKIGITGFDELINGLKNYTIKSIHKMGLQTETSIRKMEGTAKILVNKDTSRLVNSIIILPIGFNLVKELLARTNYAVHQEFGTKFQKGKPYMRPAYNKEAPKYFSKIKKILANGKV